MRIQFIAVFVAVLVPIASCVSANRESLPSSYPPGQNLSAVGAGNSTEFLVNTAEPNGVLSLGDVFALVLTHNPRLSAFSYEVRAQEALILQSSLLPNPELGVATENFGGTGATKGFDSAETTVEVSQLASSGDIVLGQKRVGRGIPWQRFSIILPGNFLQEPIIAKVHSGHLAECKRQL